MTAEPATRLNALHQAAERVSANLVELELDSGRQLLAASPLTGESAARWSAANAALTELWRRHGLLEELLGRADQRRGSRHVDELRALLDGPSIELASTEVPLAQRSLLGGTQNAERCSPDQLLAAMSTAFDEVKLVVSAIGQAWETLVPRLDEGRRRLDETERLAGEVGEAGRADLRKARRELDRLRAELTGDPLSVSPAAVEAATRSIEEIHADLQASAGLKRSFESRMLAARELLEELRSTAAAAQRAHEEVRVKISVPGAPPAAGGAAVELERGLGEIADLAGQAGWREARMTLEDWTAEANGRLGEARRALEANQAPLEARNQFRALLEAYQVKAKRLGRLEDAELAAIFARAHEALYTAPTDLALAAQLVRRYQQALSQEALR